MAYLGNIPATGENNAFRILDDISSHVVSFNGSSASVVSVSADTITIAGSEHRYITGQRVTYSKGGGTVITGLTDATAYYVIKDSDTTIQLATTASNANNGVAINLTGLGAGTAHTLTLAFDGTNTKFKPTYNDGSQNPIITRAAQLVLSLNGVIQQPIDSASPSAGFGIDVSGNIIFSTAPDANDDFWGHVHAANTVTFDISDNDIDNFTGDGSTANFNLSKTPPNNENILVTLDGVVQYPSDNSNTRAYTLSENELQMVSAPASGVAIQVRHIGFAGPTSGGSGGVTGFYGRTGNVVLKNTDNPVIGNLTAVDAAFSGNVSIAKTLTYMDVAHVDAVGIITAQSGIQCLDDLNVGLGTFFVDKSTGRVGIGTENPDSSLHIKSASSPTIHLEDTTQTSKLKLYAQDSSTVIGNYSNHALQFVSNSLSRIQLTNDGKVQIGLPGGSANLPGGTSVVNIRGMSGGNLHIRPSTDLQGSTTGIGIDSLNDAGNTVTDLVLRGATTYFRNSSGESLRIDSDGKLLIGITASTSGDGQLQSFKPSGNNSTVVVGNVATSASGLCRYDFCPSNSTVGARIECHAIEDFSENAKRTADLVFITRKDGTNSEKLRITSDGKFGFNTSTIRELLHVHKTDSAEAYLRFTNTTTGTGGGDGFNIGINSAEQPLIWNKEYTDMLFGTHGATRMVIDKDGDVGIGEASPGSNNEKLTVREDIAAASGKAIISIFNLYQGTSGQGNQSTGALEFTFKNHNASHNWWGGRIACFNTDNYNQYTYLRFDTASQGNASGKMWLTHNGRLGIGTDNPQRKLEVWDASESNIRIEGGADYFELRVKDSDNAFGIHKNIAGGGSSEVLRIGSDGTVQKYLTGTTIQAAFPGAGQVNGITALPSYVGTPFVVGKDTGSGRSATFAGVVQTGNIIALGTVGIGTDNPDQSLEVFKASGTNLVKVSTQANSTIGIELEKTGATTQSWRIADGQTVNGMFQIYDVTDSKTPFNIDTGQRVLLGSTSSRFYAAKLQVQGASDSNYILMHNTTAGDGDGARYSKFIYSGTQSGGETSDLAHINAAHDGTADDQKGRIEFRTNAGSSNHSPAERLRITSEGYLKLVDNGGTYTNTTQSYSAEGAFLTHYTARTTSGGDKYRRMFDIASVGANPWGSSIRFLTSADSTNPATTVERVRIDHNGRVGINKTTPATMLSIKAERSAVPRFGIDGHYSDSSYTQCTWDDSNGLYTLLGVNHKLDANGNDASPVSSLHSASMFLNGRSGDIRFYTKPDSGTTFNEVLRMDDSKSIIIGNTTTSGNKLYFQSTSGSAQWIQATGTDNQDLQFGRGGSSYMRIDNGGRIRIGDPTKAVAKGALIIDNEDRNALADRSDPDKYGIVLCGSSTNDQGNGIAFCNDNAQNTAAAIIAVDRGSNNLGDLRFYTKHEGAPSNGPLEGLRINQQGQITGVTSGVRERGQLRTLESMSMPKWIEGYSDSNSDLNVAASMFHQTHVRGTGHLTTELFSTKMGGNGGMYVQVEVWFSCAVANYQGYQMLWANANRTSWNNFTINNSGQEGNKLGSDTGGYFNLTYDSSGSGADQRLTWKVVTSFGNNYVRCLYKTTCLGHDYFKEFNVIR